MGVARAGFFGVQPGRRPDVWIPFVDGRSCRRRRQRAIAYGVGRRGAEIAVRVALGIPLSLWSGRLIAAQLAGVTPRDPAAFAAGAAILIAIAGLAGYVPARRATLIEPAAALKQE